MASKQRSEALSQWIAASRPYLPGRGPRPAGDDEVHRIAGLAPAFTDPDAWRDNAAWLAGVDLYRAGFFWEAHEVWEPVWMNARPNSRERILTQAMIQLTNAALKQQLQRHGAAARLAEISSGLLADIASPQVAAMGVVPATMVQSVADYAKALRRGEHNAPRPPIQLASLIVD